MGASSRLRIPSCLVKHGNIYYFRAIVPEDLRPCLKQREYRLSLRTGFLAQAKIMATSMKARLNTLFHLLRQEHDLMAGLSDQQIREIAHEWIKKTLNQYEEIRLRRSEPWSAEKLSEYLDSLDRDKELYSEKLLEGHYYLVEPGALELLEEKGIQGIEVNSLEFRALCSALLKGMIAVFTHEKRRASGETLDDDIDTMLNTCLDKSPQPQYRDQITAKPQIPLKDALESYRSEKTRLGEWKGRTEADMRPRLDLFYEVVDNIPINSLSKAEIRDFKQAVEHLPTRRSINPKYKGKSLNELRVMKIPKQDLISNNTVGQYFGAVRSFLYWLKANYEDITDGLTDVLKPPSVAPADEQRHPFSEDDIQKIFSTQGFNPDEFKQAYKFWVPLIGLYSGMRLEEMCQLTVDDIKEIDGIWCFDVNDHGDKRIKTHASRRYVPIHPNLINRLGFIDFVDFVKGRGSARLFPDLKKQNGRYSHYLSRWFNGSFLPKAGIDKDDGKKVFHSFRHTYAHTCKLLGIPEDKVSQLMGHENSNSKITYNRYGKKYPPSILFNDVVSKIGFDIDLDQLKNSKHVKKKSLAIRRPQRKKR